jgi:hypothetical protein
MHDSDASLLVGALCSPLLILPCKNLIATMCRLAADWLVASLIALLKLDAMHAALWYWNLHMPCMQHWDIGNFYL